MRLPSISLALLCVTCLPSFAHAGRGEFGTGEQIDFLTRLPKTSPVYKKYSDPVRTFDSIGFRYGKFSFVVPFWTWGGEYVLSWGREYVTIGKDRATVAQTLGVSEDELAKPFFYSYPPGLVCPLALVLFYALVFLVANTLRNRRIRELAQGPKVG